MAKSELKKSKKSVKPSKKEEKVSKQKKEESSSTEDSSSAEESSSDSDSSSSSDEEEEKKEEKKESSDSDSSSSSDEEEEKKEEKKESSDSDSDSDSSSSDEEEEEKKEEKKESSDSDSSSDDEEKDSKKRKAEDTEEVTEAKKPKTEEEAEPATIFVGRLSWGVDDDQLKEAFNHIGGVIGARVLTERDTGRSRGYGYVDFETKEQAEKAISEMQGAEIDGRPVNLDMSTSKPRQQNSGERSNDRAKKFGDAPSEPSDTLFVGNLSFQTDRDSVQNFFSEYGTVLGVRLPTHPETEQPKGFGYVQFSSVDEAKSALEGLNGEYLNDRAVRLDFSTPRPQNNGGGFNRSRSGTPSGGRGGRGGFRDGGRGGRGGRGGFRDGGRGGSRGGFGGRDRNSGSGSNSIPVQFKGNKKTFD